MSDQDIKQDTISNEEDKVLIEQAKTTEPEKVEETEKTTEPEKVEETEDGKIIVEEKKQNNDDIFITEADRFVITVSYYMNKKNLIVESVDSEYQEFGNEIKSFTVTLKYPSQRDADAISSARNVTDLENMTYVDMIQLENLRLVTLIREWSLDKPLAEIVNLNPKIIKGIKNKISEEIGSLALL